MRRPLQSNDFIARSFREAAFGRWQLVAALLLVACCVIAAVAFTAQQRRQSSAQPSTPQTSRSGTESPAQKPQRIFPHTKSRDVYAAWYDVPLDSLAKRRAGLQELTAAHNKLPLGTLLRVTHLENGRSVIVRVTDRGIHKRGVKLDVCKEAAEELDMIGKGIARVRIEIVPDEEGVSPPESHDSAPQL